MRPTTLTAGALCALALLPATARAAHDHLRRPRQRDGLVQARRRPQRARLHRDERVDATFEWTRSCPR
jgi:hypothetical protein